ncbi:hypothetical protein M408DRAFT_334150 [Serendipita vermifera MAFF 305830]|uniref:Uncharacterized protein n=1 Tax=Serendipita vermifera MAFF 305830 TaxID=933852 RepID=A0A0C3ALB0_SERVB|nr:hypothetical protein M408DRAFT_334150 [Serendipita vermifera MAFF 305830]
MSRSHHPFANGYGHAGPNPSSGYATSQPSSTYPPQLHQYLSDPSSGAVQHQPDADGTALEVQNVSTQTLVRMRSTTRSSMIQFQTMVQQCRLTTTQEGIKTKIFDDLDQIAKEILKVYDAHVQASLAIQDMVANRTRNSVATVEGHLSRAQQSVITARETINRMRNQILGESTSLQQNMPGPPNMFMNQAYNIVNYKLPSKCTIPSFVIGTISLAYSQGNAAQIQHQVTGALVGQYILSYGGIAFGSFLTAIGFIGQNAGIYSSEPRAKTEKALAAIHGYLKQFSLAMLSLSVYWGSAHIPNLSDEKWKDEPGALHQIGSTVQKHIDDCLDIITAIYCGIPNIPTDENGEVRVIPSALEAGGESEGQIHRSLVMSYTQGPRKPPPLASSRARYG